MKILSHVTPCSTRKVMAPTTAIAVIPPVVVWGGKLIRYFAKFEKLGKPFRWILSLGEKKVAKIRQKFGVFL